MAPESPSVVLLRSSDVVPPDRYEEALEKAGWNAVCVPVLEFRFPHQDRLQRVLQHPDRFDGLVVTSPRALQAMNKALDYDLALMWDAKTAYTVGTRTAETARRMDLTPKGQGSGAAKDLAAFIINDLREKNGDEIPRGTVLFLAGDRRRDELPDTLSAGGVLVQEMIVYETLTRAKIDVPAAEWLVFFSPSGVQSVQRSDVNFEAYRRAAIGPTTASELDQAGFPAHAVADEPSPSGIVEAIQSADVPTAS